MFVGIWGYPTTIVTSTWLAGTAPPSNQPKWGFQVTRMVVFKSAVADGTLW